MASVYFHVPFCKQACHYCNFHFSTSLRNKTLLIKSMLSELELRKSELSKTELVNSIYFGGGTPSLLSAVEIKMMIDAVKANFSLSSKLEITLEMNPDDDTRSVVFTCRSETLVGILHEVPHKKARGVLIVVGGPQYRVGSHRQFVFLAQELARQGIPVFRFDYRGMGDSTGDLQGFEGIEADIRSAIDAFFASCSGLVEVTIWGLCDAATAAAF